MYHRLWFREIFIGQNWFEQCRLSTWTATGLGIFFIFWDITGFSKEAVGLVVMMFAIWTGKLTSWSRTILQNKFITNSNRGSYRAQCHHNQFDQSLLTVRQNIVRLLNNLRAFPTKSASETRYVKCTTFHFMCIVGIGYSHITPQACGSNFFIACSTIQP